MWQWIMGPQGPGYVSDEPYTVVSGSPTVVPFTNGNMAAMNPKDKIGMTKPDLTLIPGTSLIYQAMAMANGAEKYGPYNWREKDAMIQYTIYLAAIMRHVLALIDGEDEAADSHIHHLAHILAGAGILVDAMEGGHLIDNRPKPGASSYVLKKFTEVKK